MFVKKKMTKLVSHSESDTRMMFSRMWPLIVLCVVAEEKTRPDEAQSTIKGVSKVGAFDVNKFAFCLKNEEWIYWGVLESLKPREIFALLFSFTTRRLV